MSRRTRFAVFAVGAAGLMVLFVLAAFRLPDFGGRFHPYGERAVTAAIAEKTKNVVSSVNFDQRAFDTVGEELILFASALGAVVLLRMVRREREEEAGEHGYGPADVFDALRLTGYLLLPVTLLVGVYIVAHGHLSPGGGFQGGVVLGTALHLLYLTGDYPALARLRPVPVFETAEALGAGAFVVLGLAGAGLLIPMNSVVGLEVGCAFVLVLAKFFEQALLVRTDEAGKEGS
ncbi:MnhB domain-containing protein [Actinoallomurus rhizosphaericola]|uniref:MnhB domain-containing protein n=1 Tax=Actinoallomurus rhizosphaericola TaxID=2952536 RepID=UPI002092DF9E|nr:MnhB domain-containing protein [Actinoallomurus rhizosphaericola]MCO5997157.1 sodium:proton antiporter [Actinoallomurus rhizosphaericola]